MALVNIKKNVNEVLVSIFGIPLYSKRLKEGRCKVRILGFPVYSLRFDDKVDSIHLIDQLSDRIDRLEFWLSHQQPLVSIVMPVFNLEKVLIDTLNSILDQTYTNWELICVDDGSTDSSLRILNDYAALDNRITVLHQENKGPGSARNNGMELARGAYLAILDGDDIYSQNYLSKMVYDAVRSGADIVACRASMMNEDGVVVPAPGTINQKFIPKKRFFNVHDFADGAFQLFVGWTWDKIFKRSFIIEKHLKFQTIRNTDDAFFTFSAICLANKIVITNESLVAHRCRNDSVSSTRDKDPTAFVDAVVEIKQKLQAEGLFNELEGSYVRWLGEFVRWYLDTLKLEANKKMALDAFVKLEFINNGNKKFIADHSVFEWLKNNKIIED